MANIDPDFNIADIVAKIPAGLRPKSIGGNYSFNDRGIVLVCDIDHDDLYLYAEINPKLKCKTCNCKRAEKAVIGVVDSVLKTTCTLPRPNLVLCREYNMKILLSASEKFNAVVTPTSQGRPIIAITLPPPYQKKIIYDTIRKFLVDNRDKFCPKLHKIATKLVAFRVEKEPMPKTLEMLIARGATKTQIDFDPDILPPEESKLLCIENCYY